MNKMSIAGVLLLLIILLNGCGLNNVDQSPASTNSNTNAGNETAPEKSQPRISQGAFGRVEVYSGNCMPGPAEIKSGCSIKRDSRKIYFKEQTTSQNKNQAKLVKTVQSDSQGNYQAELPAGKYSIFIEDEGGEYCNGGNGAGIMCPLEIIQGQAKELNLRVDHAVW